ncbi:MAG: efflux RND transporter periplasmic adaptor subunit [Paracoccaceae bacterium]|nr:efflux RND transporter periplasmic adaptor subunit [Paracoccaceae bacterium]
MTETDVTKTASTPPARKPSLWKRMGLMLLLIVVIVAVLGFGFYRHIQHLIASAPKPTPATVSATEVTEMSWQPQLSAVGALSAVHGVDVAPQVAGVVAAIPVKSGTVVKAGDVLIQLNDAPDKAQLASLEAALELSQTVLARDIRLHASQAVSQSTLDADAADLKSRTALVAQQKALIAEKTVTAPFGGQLGIVNVNLGQYLTPGTPIVTLQDLSAMHDDFTVPQSELSSLALGQKIAVSVDAYPGRSFTGTITAISPKVDATTRNVTVQATIPNPDGALRPGMFVHTTINLGKPVQQLTLPVTAVTYNSYGATAFVVTKAKNGSGLQAEQVFVTPGDRRGNRVAILKGLKAGDQVVTSGQLKLTSGAAVQIDNSVQPSDSASPQLQEE